MDDILNRIDGMYNELIVNIEKYEYNISRIQALKNIINILTSDRTYKEKNNQLVFLKDELMFVFNNKKASSYYEIIKMAIIGLIKCENNHRIEEYNADDFTKRLLDSVSLLKKDMTQIEEINTKLNYQVDKSKFDSINRLKQLIQIGCINDNIMIEIKNILERLNINNKDIIIFLDDFRICKQNQINSTKELNAAIILKHTFKYINVDIKYDDVAYAKKIYDALLVDLNNHDIDKVLGVIQSIENECIQKYLYIKVAKYYKNQYDSMCKLLEDIELYLDEGYRQEILMICQQYIDTYDRVCELYEQVGKKNTLQEKKQLFAFSHYGDGELTYFQRDLEDLNPDILGSVQKLLDDIIIESPLIIRKKLRGSDITWEFKYDNVNNQLRIIFYYSNGIPVISGVIRKKDLNDRMKYSLMNNRCHKLLSNPPLLDKFDEDYKMVLKYIRENQREGKRK